MPPAMRIADASDKLSTAIRPKKKKTHRVRNLLIGAAVIGGVFALVQSPLRGKIQERLFGPAPSDDDDLPQITLPDDDPPCRDHRPRPTAAKTKSDPEPATDVVGTPVVAEPAPRGSRSHGHNHDEPSDNQRRPMPDDRPYQGRSSSDRPSFSGPRQFSGPRPSFNNNDSAAVQQRLPAAVPTGSSRRGSGGTDVALASPA